MSILRWFYSISLYIVVLFSTKLGYIKSFILSQETKFVKKNYLPGGQVTLKITPPIRNILAQESL